MEGLAGDRKVCPHQAIFPLCYLEYFSQYLLHKLTIAVCYTLSASFLLISKRKILDRTFGWQVVVGLQILGVQAF